MIREPGTKQFPQKFLVTFCCFRKRGRKDHVPTNAVDGPEAGP